MSALREEAVLIFLLKIELNEKMNNVILRVKLKARLLYKPSESA